MKLVISQTLALLWDAQRELRAGKVFWLSLILVAISVGAFAGLGISKDGFSYLWWTFPTPNLGPLDLSMIAPEQIYRAAFAGLAIPVVNWGVTVLAIISTAGIIPTLITSGAIDVQLSRPLGRVRLLLTKFFGGLMFVGAQATLFSVGWFLILGLRAGDWEPRMFVAVPLVMLFFSYLYSVSVLVGLVSKSAVTTIIVTGLMWLMIILVNFAEVTLMTFEQAQVARVEQAEQKLAERRAALDAATSDYVRQQIQAAIAVDQRDVEAAQAEASGDLRGWVRLISGVKAVLPKTQETIGLIERVVLTQDDVDDLREASEERRRRQRDEMVEAAERVEDILRSRSAWSLIGSSLLFEAAVLGLASILFARREF